MLVSIPFFYSFNSISLSILPITILDVTPRWQLDDYVFKLYHVYFTTHVIYSLAWIEIYIYIYIYLLLVRWLACLNVYDY